MNEEIKTYRLIIKGKVQNVGFRHWFSDLAISLIWFFAPLDGGFKTIESTSSFVKDW